MITIIPSGDAVSRSSCSSGPLRHDRINPLRRLFCFHDWVHVSSECGITGRERVGDLTATLHFEWYDECRKCGAVRRKKEFEGTRADASAFRTGRKPAGGDIEKRNSNGRAAGYSGCGRCGGTWDWKREHCTDYDNGSGCFPLCEECWAQLSPRERLPYYNKLVDDWHRWDRSEEDYERHEANRLLIVEAVLEGK